MQSQQKVVRNFLMELDTSADTYMEISWYLKETLKSNIFCDSLFYDHLEEKWPGPQKVQFGEITGYP